MLRISLCADHSSGGLAVSAIDFDGIPDQNKATVLRLNALAAINSTKRYLEIGVYKGDTFLALDFEDMVAVDPNPKFHHEAFEKPGRSTRACTSDDFFTVEPAGRSFDLMFLDGLHTFEQSFRDFCALLALSHSRSIWLLDDTVPGDLLAALPNLSDTLEMRRQLDLKQKAWQGDVFKTAFAIHDFFPTFDFRTIMGKGNPQTIFLRSPRVGFRPRWNNLEAISRLTYFDFVEHRDLLNPCSEDEALTWVRSVLG